MFVLTLPFVLTALSTASTVPRVLAPVWIELVQIGDKVVRNGLPATIYAFSTDRSPEEVFTYYRNVWQGRGPAEQAVREVYIAPWRILSHVENRLLYTVQVRDDSRPGTIGYLAVTEPDNVRTVEKGDIPALEGSRGSNVVQFEDNGQKSRICQFENSSTLEQNVAFYEEYYTAHGWISVDAVGGEEKRVLRFNRRDRVVNIVLNSAGGMTRVVVNMAPAQ